jgi:hypothetical protein
MDLQAFVVLVEFVRRKGETRSHPNSIPMQKTEIELANIEPIGAQVLPRLKAKPNQIFQTTQAKIAVPSGTSVEIQGMQSDGVPSSALRFAKRDAFAVTLTFALSSWNAGLPYPHHPC